MRVPGASRAQNSPPPLVPPLLGAGFEGFDGAGLDGWEGAGDDCTGLTGEDCTGLAGDATTGGSLILAGLRSVGSASAFRGAGSASDGTGTSSGTAPGGTTATGAAAFESFVAPLLPPSAYAPPKVTATMAAAAAASRAFMVRQA